MPTTQTEQPKRKPGRPKKTPPGQGSIDFNSTPAPKGANQWPKSGSGGPTGNVPSRLSQTHQSGATSRPTGAGPARYSRAVGGVSGTPQFSSVSPDFNARGPQPKVRVSGGNPITQPGAVPAPWITNPGRVPVPLPKPPNGPDAFGPRRSPEPYFTLRKPERGPILLTGKVSPPPPPPKGKGNLKSRLALGLLGLATAGGVGYLASRSRENEVAAKPGPQAPENIVPGRNAPPSTGNAADRALYSEPSGPNKVEGGSNQPGLSERARNNQRANRNPDDYLGEAFDATVKRGRAVGRKHLQGMLVRDAVDSDTAAKLMNRYDKEINSQSTLANYRDKGVTQEFDKTNPRKAGRLLEEYRAMGRSDNAAPRGATLAELKARALK